MKNLLTVVILLTGWVTSAQTKVSESAVLQGQTLLELGLDFADDIEIIVWQKNEVLVEALVTINGGEYDHIFTLEKQETNQSIRIDMDNDMWNKVDRKDQDCGFRSEINYKVYLPASLILESSTINSSYLVKNYNQKLKLKTISGDIDLWVSDRQGIDFKAKTISGEIYSNLEIEYPYGKEGLKQVVGMNISGRVRSGGAQMELETISGNIYLRKG